MIASLRSWRLTSDHKGLNAFRTEKAAWLQYLLGFAYAAGIWLSYFLIAGTIAVLIGT